LQATIERFAALGLEVELTELDVGVARLKTDLPRDSTRRPRSTATPFPRAALLPACRGVTTWGIVDTYSWDKCLLGIDDVPLLFGDGWVRKPPTCRPRGARHLT